MNLDPSGGFPFWLSLGARVVGATFIWAGAIKAIAPHAFRNHLSSLGFVPSRFHSMAVTTAAAGEVAWGAALLTSAASGIVLPATILLLAILTTVSWWGVRSGKAKDCGCYGGFVQPSIAQSIALNALFALFAALAWLAGDRDLGIVPWQALAMGLGAVAAGGLAHAAQRFEQRTGNPMFDTSPLKVGGKWRHAWADGATKGINGEILVAYLGPSCPFCSQFVKVANVMVQSSALPRVIGVMAAPHAQVNSYKESYDIRFPVVTISDSLMGRMVRAVPTAVIVESGMIREMWVGHMPPAIVDRLRDAFFPDLAKRTAESVG